MTAPAALCLAAALAAGAIPGAAWAADADILDQARSVYADLVRMSGDDRTPPDLAVEPLQDYQVALFDAERHRIVLEPQAVSVCASFGAEAPLALAALLGHELGHFYLGHTWRADFGRRGEDPGGALTLQEAAEAQADRQAGYYAYMAGYPIAGVMPRLLTAIYRAYGLPEDMPGYPSLSQRRRQASRIENEFKPAVWSFEAGKRLMLLGRPADAVVAFDRAAVDFPSREVLCAAGEARLLAVREEWGPDRFPWALPLLLDPRSRGANPSTQVSDERDPGGEARRTDSLSQALLRFQQAALKDPSYDPARVGQACALLLLGRDGEAVALAQATAATSPDPEVVDAAKVVLALADALNGRRGQAHARLAGLDPSLPWVRANLEVLSPDPDAAAPGPERVLDPDEALAGWKPWERSTWADTDWQWMQLTPARGETLNIYTSERAGVFAVRSVRGVDETMTAVTRPAYGGQTARGIKVGSDAAQVQKAYGRARGVWVTTQGSYFLYRDIGFLIRGGKVAEWMLY